MSNCGKSPIGNPRQYIETEAVLSVLSNTIGRLLKLWIKVNAERHSQVLKDFLKENLSTSSKSFLEIPEAIQKQLTAEHMKLSSDILIPKENIYETVKLAIQDIVIEYDDVTDPTDAIDAMGRQIP